jgi:hypothetical protein
VILWQAFVQSSRDEPYQIPSRAKDAALKMKSLEHLDRVLTLTSLAHLHVALSLRYDVTSNSDLRPKEEDFWDLLPCSKLRGVLRLDLVIHIADDSHLFGHPCGS